MAIRAPHVVLVLLTSVGGVGAAPPPIPDELLTAYYAAVKDLSSGTDRQRIVDRLRPVVEKNTTSGYFDFVNDFFRDLAESARNLPKPDGGPEHRLAETRVLFALMKYEEHTDRMVADLLKQHPDDPVCQLITKDRTVIGRLLPLLRDRSPTRTGDEYVTFGRRGPWPQPRVGDMALRVIEYHSACSFCRDTTAGAPYLHQLSADRREAVVSRVEEWWKENKDKPLAAGVRAQLPHAGSYPEKVSMAKTLIRLGKGKPTGDAEFGRTALLDMIKASPRSHVAAYAADALAECGDTSAVDIFYEEWKSCLGKPGSEYDAHITFYLSRHGRRREWELLSAIELDKASAGAIVRNVLNSNSALNNPYVIPLLGAGLWRTNMSGARYVAGHPMAQPCSTADTAAEYLQKYTGRDFGYRPAGTLDERLAAIRKAEQWWESEGKETYTFDYIEKNLFKKNRPAPKK